MCVDSVLYSAGYIIVLFIEAMRNFEQSNLFSYFSIQSLSNQKTQINKFDEHVSLTFYLSIYFIPFSEKRLSLPNRCLRASTIGKHLHTSVKTLSQQTIDNKRTSNFK